ncbi:MAG: NAD(+)/NADH kinase [Candidatus Bathyarchaeia archaeon]
MFNSVGITARLDKEASLELARTLQEHLERKGLKVYLEHELAKKIGKTRLAVSLNEMKTDFVITIGGDGTILRTILYLPKPEPPILAINMGERGFLTEVSPNESIEAVNSCLMGKFTLERHMKLASFLDEKKLPDALNEVFITSDAPVKLLYANIWKDNTIIGEVRADALIVATQVGSTAYSLAAGGPLLDPEIDAFVLTPVCPLSVFHPIVFPSKSTVTIEILRPRKITVVIDGDYREIIEAEKPKLRMAKSMYESSFIRFRTSFYQRLKSRLLSTDGGKNNDDT